MTDATRDPSRFDPLALRGPEAFARLVAEHQPMVASLGQSMGLAGHDLDDAVADAFARIWRALSGFAGRSQIRTWIYRIAARAMLRTVAARRRDPLRSLGAFEPAATAGAPDQDAARRQSHEAIWQAVAGLEPRQAAAIEMHYRQGLSVAQIAEALDCPAGTAKTLLFRARDQLRRRLRIEDLQP